MATIAGEGSDNPLPPELVRAINHKVVKKEWQDVYEYVCVGRVPLLWRRAFGEDSNLGNVSKVQSEYYI
jgi:hypothetical protein